MVFSSRGTYERGGAVRPLDGGSGPGGHSGGAFAPIADFGFLSDCETTALVAPNGNVEWLCLPRMDSPSVFGSILDRDAGYFRIGPAGRGGSGRPALHSRHPRPGDHVVDAGRLAGRDGCSAHGALAPRGRAVPVQPAGPTDYDADHVLLRKVQCVNGNVQVGWTACRCSTTAATPRSGTTKQYVVLSRRRRRT